MSDAAEDNFPDAMALIIMIRRSGDTEAFQVAEFVDPQDVIDALRETAGTLELEMREASGEFDTDLNDGDEDDE